MTADEAEALLVAWASVTGQRDLLVREARAAGVPVLRISTLTGLGRDTVYRILEKQ